MSYELLVGLFLNYLPSYLVDFGYVVGLKSVDNSTVGLKFDLNS